MRQSLCVGIAFSSTLFSECMASSLSLAFFEPVITDLCRLGSRMGLPG